MSKNIEYNWNDYQKKIFDFVINGNGNLVVEACAGSGKSTTMIKCLDYINEDKKVLLTSFNRDITSVLLSKTEDKKNVTVMTIHSLGLLMLKKNYRNKQINIDEFKYRSYVINNINKLSSINISLLDKRKKDRYIDNICKYVDYGRFYLCQTKRDLNFISERYNIEDFNDEMDIALKVMNWGKEHINDVDYTDMVWLPVVLYCRPIGMLYDWIFVDECQDLSKMQRELLLKCRKINTRMVSFGDSNQCIYTFAGSDINSFNELKAIPNTSFLPLSISYRCPKNIVNFAKNIVKSIEYNNDGRNGEVLFEADLSCVNDGDMVLCRNNAPLMKIYADLIKEGKKCYIRGKDIGLNLKNTVLSTGKDKLNIDMVEDGVFARLYLNLLLERKELMQKKNIDLLAATESTYISNKIDIITALEILSKDLNTTEELLDKIDNIFSDENNNGVELSTIHKAKGLECDNVYIACKSLMPSNSAKLDWEIEQEYNLMYVSYTRAKNRLAFLTESGFDRMIEPSQKLLKRIGAIEKVITRLFNIKIDDKINKVEESIDIISAATKVELPKPNIKKMIVNNNNSLSNLNNIFNGPKVRRKK